MHAAMAPCGHRFALERAIALIDQQIAAAPLRGNGHARLSELTLTPP
jgi:hypothetical protein